MKKKTAVIIFCKYPEPGKVKTRLTLGGSLTDRDACDLAEAMLKDTICIALRSTADFLILGYSPEYREQDFWDIYKRILKENPELKGLPTELFLQSGVNFDKRFQSVAEQAFERDFTHLVILGADLPYMLPEIINKSFEVLGDGEKNLTMVLGPAGGGGIYLVGINRSFEPGWFSKFSLFGGGIEMHQFSDLIAKFKFALHILPTLNDIDMEDDLISLIISLNSMKHAVSVEGMSYPVYFAEAVEKLGITVDVGDTHNRSRKLTKVGSLTADH